VKSILSNIPPTTTRNVLVEGFDYESEVDGIFESSGIQVDAGFEENSTSNPSSFGIWLELVAVALFAFAACGVLSSFSVVVGNLGVLASFVLTAIGLIVAFTSGLRDGDPGRIRVTVAMFVAIGSVAFACFSLVQGGMAVSVWPTTLAVTGAIAFWSLLRLTGETTLRCLSLGLAAAVPLLLIAGPVADSLYARVDRVAVWFASAFFDLASIAYGIRDLGFQFVGGEIASMASENNFTGIAGPIGLVVAASVILRQSLILTLLSGLSAIAWWSIFRGFVCLSAVQNLQMDGTWDLVAMPLYGWLILMLVIAGTQVFLSLFLAPLPLDEHPIDHPVLSQLYNWLVSFPQTGPKHRALFAPYRRSVIESEELMQEDEIGVSSTPIEETAVVDQVQRHQDGDDWEPVVKSTARFARKSPSK
jgi:hypothetical protein